MTHKVLTVQGRYRGKTCVLQKLGQEETRHMQTSQGGQDREHSLLLAHQFTELLKTLKSSHLGLVKYLNTTKNASEKRMKGRTVRLQARIVLHCRVRDCHAGLNLSVTLAQSYHSIR